MSEVTTKAISKSIQHAMELSKSDRGHRIGNFHNYYAFHPTKARIDPLLNSISSNEADVGETRSGILEYVVKSFMDRLCEPLTSNAQEQSSGQKASIPTGRKRHRTDTTSHKRAFCLLDIGCNEGDLTTELSCQLAQTIQGHLQTNIRARQEHLPNHLVCSLGVDIDPILISRAVKKVDTCTASSSDEVVNGRKEASSSSRIHATFEVCNVCDPEALNKACDEFWSNTKNCSSDTEEESDKGRTSSQKRFDLTTVFSTTMWIHIHAGDDGLRNLLRRVCERTEMLLIEPQPSRW